MPPNTKPSDVEVIPAILVQDFQQLQELVQSVSSETKKVQVDVVDGVFVRGRTWPYGSGQAGFDKIVAEEQGMPLWETIDYEFDLMIDHPERDIAKFVQAGAHRIVLHAASEGVHEAFQALISTREEDGGYAVEVGVALLPTVQPEELDPFEGQFDFVQVMGISRIGRQGEPFEKHALFLVERLRRRYPGLIIQVDGGITHENIQALVHAGANRLVVGSAVFKAENPLEALVALTNEARTYAAASI